jgi:hypothetical protein
MPTKVAIIDPDKNAHRGRGEESFWMSQLRITGGRAVCVSLRCQIVSPQTERQDGGKRGADRSVRQVAPLRLSLRRCRHTPMN